MADTKHTRKYELTSTTLRERRLLSAARKVMRGLNLRIEHASAENKTEALSRLKERGISPEAIKRAVHKGVMALSGSVAGKQIHDALDAFAKIRELCEAAPLPAEGVTPEIDAIDLARRFHTVYEALAPNFGYETRRESARPWSQVPEKNKDLMIAVCEQIIKDFHLGACGSTPECVPTMISVGRDFAEQEQNKATVAVNAARMTDPSLRNEPTETKLAAPECVSASTPETHEQMRIRKCVPMLPFLQQEARKLGYALLIHGSLQRDFDLVAVPWVKEAVSASLLAEVIRATAADLNNAGVAFIAPHEDDAFHRAGCPGMKPHGRLCWSFHLGGGPYIDLSVMPITKPPFTSAEEIIAATAQHLDKSGAAPAVESAPSAEAKEKP